MTLPTGPAPATSGVMTAWAQLVDQIFTVWREAGLVWKPRVRWFPRIPPHLDIVFGWLFDPADGDDADAILFCDERSWSPLHDIRDHVGGLQLPMIDIRGRAGEFADAAFDIMQPPTWSETARRIVGFRRQREKLAPRYRQTGEPDLQLLAHMYVSGRPLRGMRYPLTPEAVCYPGFFSAARVVPIAEELALRGLLRKTFLDRLHECRICRSRRLSAREECPSCRSADLRETGLIHHYQCAALLPEEQFRRGAALVCPKCSRQLRNYGKDYDRPGHAYVCNTCDATSSEPEVGFVCLDCSARMDGDAAERVDIFSYSLTDAARALLEGRGPMLAARMPVSLQREVARINATAGMRAGIAEIRFAGKEELIATHGPTAFRKSRDLLVENLRNRLAGVGSVHVAEDAVYILIERFEAQAEAWLRSLLLRSENLLRHKLDARLTIAKILGTAQP